MKKAKTPNPEELAQANEERESVKRAFGVMRAELEHTGTRVEAVLDRLRRKVAQRPTLRLVKSR